MKPSKRIHEIMCEINTPPTTEPVVFAAHGIQAIINYLDEQHASKQEQK